DPGRTLAAGRCRCPAVVPRPAGGPLTGRLLEPALEPGLCGDDGPWHLSAPGRPRGTEGRAAGVLSRLRAAARGRHQRAGAGGLRPADVVLPAARHAGARRAGPGEGGAGCQRLGLVGPRLGTGLAGAAVADLVSPPVFARGRLAAHRYRLTLPALPVILV